MLLRLAREPHLRDARLDELMAEPTQAGWMTYFAPYETVHPHNIRLVAAAKLR